MDGPNDSDSDEDDDDDDDDLNDLSHDDDPEGEDKAQVSPFNKICVEQDPGSTPPPAQPRVALYSYLHLKIYITSNVFKFLLRLHGEYNTSLALWKHHVNLLLQSFRSVSSDLHNLRGGVSTKLD